MQCMHIVFNCSRKRFLNRHASRFLSAQCQLWCSQTSVRLGRAWFSEAGIERQSQPDTREKWKHRKTKSSCEIQSDLVKGQNEHRKTQRWKACFRSQTCRMSRAFIEGRHFCHWPLTPLKSPLRHVRRFQVKRIKVLHQHKRDIFPLSYSDTVMIQWFSDHVDHISLIERQMVPKNSSSSVLNMQGSH